MSCLEATFTLTPRSPVYSDGLNNANNIYGFFFTAWNRAFKLGHYSWLNTLDEPTICDIINLSLATIIGKGNGTRERFSRAKRSRKERRDAT
jgi:hypothetical protein